ncbi:MAG: glycosyltransferase [Lachnospiraceae bacterium]|nr:glycosyltransferase [Lachnospiraceae bacterium]
MKIIEQYNAQLHNTKVNVTTGDGIAGRITVIVAVYNIEQYLDRCVKSIQRQSYSNLEIILVDDGATDHSGQMCDDYAREDDRIKVIHKKNGGLSHARNAGMKLATGTYIAFVDGDDWIDERMYETMLSAMLEQEADISICRYRQVYPDETVDESTGNAVVFQGREALTCLIEERDEYQIQNAAWNKLYRRDLLQGQEFPVGRWYEDIVYTTILLSKINRCVYLDSAFYNYVLDREGSIMSHGLNARILTDQIPAYFEKTAFLRSIGEDTLADVHNYYIYKRLLILYTQFRRSECHAEAKAKRKQFCRELKVIIHQQSSEFPSAFGCYMANPNEYRKMKIFMSSTWLYDRVMDLNDAVIIPMKQRKHKK